MQNLGDRREYLGATDCAGVLGLSRWESPLSVWMAKTGAVPVEDISGKLSVRMGVKLEQAIAELFMEETGKKVQRMNLTQVHPKYDFIRAHPDRLVIGEDTLLECKTAGERSAKEWQDDEMPMEYILQCHHQMLVTGKKGVYLAALIGGNREFKWQYIARDEATIADILAKEVAFWERYVIGKEMPTEFLAHDRASEATADALKTLYPNAQPTSEINLTEDDEFNVLCEQRAASVKEKKALEKDIEKIENQLREKVKDHEVATSGIWKLTYKNQSRSTIDSGRLEAEKPDIYKEYAKTSEFRVFRATNLLEVKKDGKSGSSN